MSGNKIVSEGAMALAEMLKANSTLQSLHVYSTWGTGNAWFYMKDPQPVMSEAGGEMKSHERCGYGQCPSLLKFDTSP